MSHSGLGRFLAAVVVVVAASAVHVVAAPPSAHAAPGFTQVVATSTANATDSKSVQAFCPAGKRVIGGGGTILGAGNQVALRMARPQPGSVSDHFVAFASETTLYNMSWSVRAIVICADPMPGWEYVAFPSSSNSNTFRSVTATCSAGKQLIGSGGSVHWGGDRVLLDSVVPSSDLRSVRTTAYEAEGGYAGDWELMAWAICVDPVPGYSVVSKLGSLSAGVHKIIFVDCPAGTRVHGVGGDFIGGAGEVQLSTLQPSGIPSTSVTMVGRTDPSGFDGSWQMRIYALCGPAT